MGPYTDRRRTDQIARPNEIANPMATASAVNTRCCTVRKNSSSR